MKTLNKIAEKNNLFTAENIPATHKECRLFNGLINEVPNKLKNIKNLETGIFYECKKENGDGTPYIESSYALVKFKDSDTVLMLTKEKKQFRFTVPYFIIQKYHGLKYYDIDKATKELKEPNFIGTFTEKKVKDWENYVNEKIKALENLLNEINGTNESINKELADLLSRFKGAKVSSYENNHYIDAGTFYITLHHDKQGAHLSKKIEFRGDINDVIKLLNL